MRAEGCEGGRNEGMVRALAMLTLLAASAGHGAALGRPDTGRLAHIVQPASGPRSLPCGAIGHSSMSEACRSAVWKRVLVSLAKGRQLRNCKPGQVIEGKAPRATKRSKSESGLVGEGESAGDVLAVFRYQSDVTFLDISICSPSKFSSICRAWTNAVTACACLLSFQAFGLGMAFIVVFLRNHREKEIPSLTCSILQKTSSLIIQVIQPTQWIGSARTAENCGASGNQQDCHRQYTRRSDEWL